MALSGLLLIDKAAGPSSFHLVARCRKYFAEKRVGHCGTLDPFAEGLMVLAIGQATKYLQFMEDYGKRYWAKARLGERRDTLDPEGELFVSEDAAALRSAFDSGQLAAELAAALPALQGRIEQYPPLYSAIKYQGKALYAYARAGQGDLVPRQPRQVEVQVNDWQAPYLEDGQLYTSVDLSVSKGTYIRSWISDWAEAAGHLATTWQLRRLEVGPFALGEAIRLDELEAAWQASQRQPALLWSELQRAGRIKTAFDAFPDWPRVKADAVTAQKVVYGQALSDGPLFAACPEGRVLLRYRERLWAVLSIRLAETGERLIQSERVFATHADL